MRVFTLFSLIAVLTLVGCEKDRRGTGGGGININGNDTTGIDTTGNGNGGSLDLKQEILGTWDVTRMDLENMKGYSNGSQVFSASHITYDLQSTFKFSNDSILEMIWNHTEISTYNYSQGGSYTDTAEVDEQHIGFYQVVDNTHIKLDPENEGKWYNLDVLTFTKNKIEMHGHVIEEPIQNEKVEYDLYINLER